MAVNSKKKRKNGTVAVGRRKTSSARIRFIAGGKEEVIVNDRELSTLPDQHLAGIMVEPLKLVGQPVNGQITAKVIGGGPNSQAQAVRHGIARLLVTLNPEYRALLKQKQYLTRDSRMKERKKPGLRRARRSPQWSKR
jgi:small subunit ribosomal protein S9